ncbi:ARF-binding protein [Polyrhizophydium stewartii]|uniref:ARF-binding protein n=1 Tax=Polyrhizophydium stewartii TaxID=2732419 RepID=A0ABR4N460_9FUNG
MSQAGNVLSGLSNLLYDSGFDQPGSVLEDMIAQACESGLPQPNLSLNLEICDMINKTKKTYPRDAAFAILKHVNRGSTTSAYLALTLLDNCVKNCGYPFHIVLGSKEFLNELVRRFPERPTGLTATQHRILELIQLWNATLCVSSRYKDDFKHINDMYRLLMYKGYRFPELREEAVLAFNGENQRLKTEDELEEEDRQAQGVKLEELLRKGTPSALAQANELMKVMAGYDTSRKPDYKKEVNQELERIESKIILLNDMLNQRRPGESLSKDQTISELYAAAKSAQTKLQSFIETNDDEDRLNRLLELNDLINTVLQKYADIKSGKPVQRNSVDRKRTASSDKDRTSPSAAAGPINLIDFDDFSVPAAGAMAFAAPGSSSTQQSSGGGLSLIDDLQSLSFGGQATQPQHQQQLRAAKPQFPQPQFPQPQFAHPQLVVGSAMPIGATLAGMQAPRPAAPAAPADPFSAIGNLALQQSSSPRPSQPAQQPSGSPNSLAGFGFAGSSTSSQASPQSASGVKPAQTLFPAAPQAGSAGVDLLSGNADLLGLEGGFTAFAHSPQVPAQRSSATGAAATKEFKMYDKNGLQIKLKIQAAPGGQQLSGQAIFINVTPVQFADLAFQLAVPKAMTLTMDKPSGSVLVPLNQAQITQSFAIANPTQAAVRLRYKVQYSINGAIVEEQGEYAPAL